MKSQTKMGSTQDVAVWGNRKAWLAVLILTTSLSFGEKALPTSKLSPALQRMSMQAEMLGGASPNVRVIVQLDRKSVV